METDTLDLSRFKAGRNFLLTRESALSILPSSEYKVVVFPALSQFILFEFKGKRGTDVDLPFSRL